MPIGTTAVVGKTRVEVDRRPKLQVLRHLDIGHSANRVAVAVETDRGPVVLVMTPELLTEHARLCGELLDMFDDATLGQ